MSHHEETHQNEGVNKTQSTEDDRQPQFHDDDMAPDDNEEVAGKIFIGGLSWSTTEQTLRYYFEKYGELSDVALMFDKRTGKPRGFGFIKMKDPAAADVIMSNDHTIDGRLVDVKRALPRDKAPGPARSEAAKIFVGGLSMDVSEQEFGDYFSKFGVVKDAVVMVDRNTGSSRGFGFVTFEREDTVDKVMKMEHELHGKYVEIKRAEPREASRGAGGGGRDGGGRDGGYENYGQAGYGGASGSRGGGGRGGNRNNDRGNNRGGGDRNGGNGGNDRNNGGGGGSDGNYSGPPSPYGGAYMGMGRGYPQPYGYRAPFPMPYPPYPMGPGGYYGAPAMPGYPGYGPGQPPAGGPGSMPPTGPAGYGGATPNYMPRADPNYQPQQQQQQQQQTPPPQQQQMPNQQPNMGENKGMTNQPQPGGYDPNMMIPNPYMQGGMPRPYGYGGAAPMPTGYGYGYPQPMPQGPPHNANPGQKPPGGEDASTGYGAYRGASGAQRAERGYRPY